MPKSSKIPTPARFHPAARFPSKAESDAMQALSIVYQQMQGNSASEPKLSLVESFQLNAMLLKVHMTRAVGRDDGVIFYRSDIPSLQFAQPLASRLTPPMIKTMQSKGYTVLVPPSSDVSNMAFVSWARDEERLIGASWVTHRRTGSLEPLHVDAELLPHEDRPYQEDDSCPVQMQQLCISPRDVTEPEL